MKKSSSVKRKRVAGATLPKTQKFGGKTYTKKACSKLKSTATKSANSARAAGKNARVVKNPAGGWCLFTRGAAKLGGLRGKSQPVHF